MIYINYYGFSTLMIDDKLHFLIRGRVFEKGYHSLTIEEERKIVQVNLKLPPKFDNKKWVKVHPEMSVKIHSKVHFQE